jgi:translation elongation factor EF-Tu-like GTPase
MKNILKKIWSWLKPKLAKLFTLTAKHVAQEVLDLLNDAELQHKALQAVQAAAEGGLKGNKAFQKAVASLTEELRKEGRELADNLKHTLIQNAYSVMKNQEP